MRYKNGLFIVTGNPSVAWIEKMAMHGLTFTVSGGVIYAKFEELEK